MILPSRLTYGAYQLFWSGLDWIYPPRCAGCGKSSARFCKVCFDAVDRIGQKVCEICGKPVSQPGICSSCAKITPSYTALRSWAVYFGPLRKAIHRLKYKRDIALGEVLSRPLIRFLQCLDWNVDMIIPVPISLARFRERGYNQASLLALPLAFGTRISYVSKGLRKIRNTHSQVGLNAEERKINVTRAFEAFPEYVHGARVLIVDDITTTGATMDACAETLKEAGALEVYGITLARSLLE